MSGGHRTITVEWRHLDVQGQTCDRCCRTGIELAGAVEELSRELSRHDIHIDYQETRLGPFEITASNAILINGVPIENLLPDARVVRTCCASCGELLGTLTDCRALELDGTLYETLPVEIIRRALWIASGVQGNCEETDKKASSRLE